MGAGGMEEKEEDRKAEAEQSTGAERQEVRATTEAAPSSIPQTPSLHLGLTFPPPVSGQGQRPAQGSLARSGPLATPPALAR